MIIESSDVRHIINNAFVGIGGGSIAMTSLTLQQLQYINIWISIIGGLLGLGVAAFSLYRIIRKLK